MASDLVEPVGQTAIYRGPLLLYDADCALCNRSVQFVLRHERPVLRNNTLMRLGFASLDGQYGEALRRRLPELADVDSLIWISPEQAEQASCDPACDTMGDTIGGGVHKARSHSHRHILLYTSPRIESDAVLSVLRYLGGVWALIAAVGSSIPKPIRDAMYRFVARHRKRGSPNNAQSCPLPPPELQSRLLN